MNRQQRRDLEKKIKKRGITSKDAKSYVEIINDMGSETSSPPKDFNEGDKVTINLEMVKARKNYDKMSKLYKEFVESNKETVFTAHIERENLISFAENPVWLFWSGDLNKANTDDGDEDLKIQETQ